MTITDRAGRVVAIRPEMTPSVTRMVSQIYETTTKPIRYFSIANFMRAEKPQRGRNREFWQLNYDIFGAEGISADLEILQIALEIMLSFEPPKGSFTLFLNHRKLIDELLRSIKIEDDAVTEAIRIMDKWEKLTLPDLEERLEKIGADQNAIEKIGKFMELTEMDGLLAEFPELKDTIGLKDVNSLIISLTKMGYGDWIKFQPNIIRGFDYYDGMVFEVFDNNPSNLRSLFGGGRYNGLSSIFGSEDIPAVGCAPGDETIKLFLESWGLLDQLESSKTDKYYLPLIDERYDTQCELLAKSLRSEGKIVERGLSLIKPGKALSYADKKRFRFVILLGEEEIRSNTYTLKDLSTGEQKNIAYSELQS